MAGWPGADGASESLVHAPAVVHAPRRLQEARIHLAKATEELRSRLGRTPTKLRQGMLTTD